MSKNFFNHKYLYIFNQIFQILLNEWRILLLGHENIVKLLLENGARLNDRDSDGYTPLHVAVSGKIWKQFYLVFETNSLQIEKIDCYVAIFINYPLCFMQITFFFKQKLKVLTKVKLKLPSNLFNLTFRFWKYNEVAHRKRCEFKYQG